MLKALIQHKFSIYKLQLTLYTCCVAKAMVTWKVLNGFLDGKRPMMVQSQV